MATGPARGGSANHIDGEWTHSPSTLEVTDLAEGGVFAELPAATPAQAQQAVEAAAAAQRAMRETTIVERAGWMESVADGIRARTEELVDVIVREAGKPVASARSEVAAAAERFERAAGEARNQQGEYLEGTTAGHEGWEAVVKPEPVGTVLCVTPYNYPLATTALQVAPALAAGNSVVLKPATKTPVSGAILAEIITEAGVPDGGFNFIVGHASDIGDTLASDERLDAVALTGSTGAGKHVARESGMVTLHMELGGNAPALIFPDADLDRAAADCAKGSFKYAGQRCSAIARVLAHEAVHDEVVAGIEAEMDDWRPGDLFDESTAVGPLISEEQADWVEELIADAVDRGAQLVRGGDRDGRTVEPTLLAEVPHDARILHEEQFGPVAAVAAVADETEALALANADDFGLDAAVFTADHDRAMRLADDIEAGAVRINGAPSHGNGDIPFGGVGDSGIGREGIGYTIEAFTTTKSIVL
ncbi:aldehyde dehydrogenase family protein [Halosegnis sp.]|uniref:aldehyde dehydrogenase family protein n=1 Tax=Halosegnis sp. TaxID=2864959 RepID=UPI0035D471D2